VAVLTAICVSIADDVVFVVIDGEVVINLVVLVDKHLLNLLFLPRFSFRKSFDELLLLDFVELRGTTVPEVRREKTKTTLIPPLCPSAAS
jgi:hypothetical protein